MPPSVTPVAATLGATVRDVDLRTLDDETFGAILDAWHRFAVLVFPGQHLDDAAQAAFTRRFGPLERSLTANRVGRNPEVIVLSNMREDGSLWPPGSEHGLFLKGNTSWHTDSSYKAVPSKGSALSARVVPDQGGETEFADMRAAYDALDPPMQAYLAGKHAVHSYAYSQGKVGGTETLSPEEWDALPPVAQPVIRTHPATGRRNLYIGRHASHIVGADEAESRALLDRLCEEACRPPRIFRHRWAVGDLVIWDNRCVLHRGRPYPGDQARHMVRTTIAGDGADNSWRLTS